MRGSTLNSFYWMQKNQIETHFLRSRLFSMILWKISTAISIKHRILATFNLKKNWILTACMPLTTCVSVSKLHINWANKIYIKKQLIYCSFNMSYNMAGGNGKIWTDVFFYYYYCLILFKCNVIGIKLTLHFLLSMLKKNYETD